MQKNSVNKSVYSKGFLAMIRDNFDVAVATDIIGKSREILFKNVGSLESLFETTFFFPALLYWRRKDM